MCCACQVGLDEYNDQTLELLPLCGRLLPTPAAASLGGIDITGMAHVILCVTNFAASRPFYQALLGNLCGLACVADTEAGHGKYETTPFLYYVGGKTAVGIHEELLELSGTTFNQRRVGLHHLCLRARTHESIDIAAAFIEDVLVPLGGKMVRQTRDDQWAPGYYSVLFEDPDGIRLEFNHIPGKGLLAKKMPEVGQISAL